MARSIAIIEDSERYIGELTHLLRGRDGLRDFNVEVVRTEVEFYRRIPQWEADPPEAFTVDVMIPYIEDGDDDGDVPHDVKEQAAADKYLRAGVRCAKAILRSKHLSEVPVVVHSILTESDLTNDNGNNENYPLPNAPNLYVCAKEANGGGVAELVDRLIADRQNSRTDRGHPAA